MNRRTEQATQALRKSLDQSFKQPALRSDERLVADTPETRLRYIQFATQAAEFYKGEKPVRFTGENWKLQKSVLAGRVQWIAFGR